MNYHMCIDKCRKVIHSCESTDQLMVAGNYCVLLIKNITKTQYGDPIELIISNRIKHKELGDWLKVIVLEKKVSLGL